MKAKVIILVYALAVGVSALILIFSMNIKKESSYALENLYETCINKSTDKTSTNFGARGALRYNEGKTNSNPFGVMEKSFAKWAQDGSGFNMPPQLNGSNSKKTILLLGDSHIGQYRAAFDLIGKALNYKIISPDIKSFYYLPTEKKIERYRLNPFADREIDINSINKQVRALYRDIIPKVDYVIIGVYNFRYSTDYIGNGADSNRYNTEECISNIKNAFLYIKKATGHYPILMQDNPLVNPAVTTDKSKYKDTLKKRLEKIYGKKLFDYLYTDDIFYDKKGRTSTYIGGLPVMDGSHHITYIYAVSATEYLMRELKKFGL